MEKKAFSIFRNPVRVIVGLYVLFNIPMLLNNGIFIDDWKYVYQTREDLIWCFKPEGWYYTGLWAIHSFLCSFAKPMLVYRLLTILFWSVILYRTFLLLNRIPINRNLAIMIILLLAVMPFNFMRYTANTFPYTLCVLLFLEASLLMVRPEGRPTIFASVLAGLLFLYAFITNSLILFFPLVLWILFKKVNYRFGEFIRTYGWLCVIPIAFLALRFTLLQPISNSTSANYNVIRPGNILIVPRETVILSLGYFRYFVHQVRVYPWLFTIFSIVAAGALLMLKPDFLKEKFSTRALLMAAVSGLVLFILAITPYILVNKFPVFAGWETRHQLLVPFGYSFLFASFLLLPGSFVARSLLAGICLGVLLTSHTAQMVHYFKGWFKYEAIEHYFRTNEAGPVKTLVFRDDDICDNATDRKISYMEIAGIYKKATGKQDRFFVGHNQQKMSREELQEWIDVRRKNHLMGPFNMKEFTTITDIGQFSIQCLSPITENDLPAFVMAYTFRDHKKLAKEYNSHLTFKITPGTNIPGE